MGTPIPTSSLPEIKADGDASVVLRHDTQARFWLAIAVIAQFVLLVGYIEFAGRELPDSQLILGAEISFVTTILAFFFGSSSGSVTKSAKGEPPTK
jgi:hypothetical protein